MFERLSGPFFVPTTSELSKANAATAFHGQAAMIKGSSEAEERRRKANQNMRLFDKLIELEQKTEASNKGFLG